MSDWTFMTNHGAVLAYIARHEKVRAVDIAASLELSERSVRRIITDLEKDGYVQRKREGRINRYTIDPDLPLRRPDSRDIRVQELLNVFMPEKTPKRGKK